MLKLLSIETRFTASAGRTTTPLWTVNTNSYGINTVSPHIMIIVDSIHIHITETNVVKIERQREIFVE